MPSIIRESYSPQWISITGESLTIDPSLKPKPTAGIQVMFKFVFAEGDDGCRSIVGQAHVQADANKFDGHNGLENLNDVSGETILPVHFRDLKRNPAALVSLAGLASFPIKRQADLEQTFLNETLEMFLESHTVTAEIDNIGGGIGIAVYFERNGLPMFTFIFEVNDQKTAEQLFEFAKVDLCIA